MKLRNKKLPLNSNILNTSNYSYMKICKTLQCFIFVVLGMLFFSCEEPIYKDSSLSPEIRAEDLIKRLSLEEKVSLMQMNSPAIPRLGIKKYDWWNEALHGVGRAGTATVFPQCIGMAASFNDELLYDVFTAISDEARAKNTKAAEAGGLKRYQGLTFWTPNVNIFRDPRWGRGQETYGEDPYLSGRMGISVVKGLQGPDSTKYDKLHACAKHYAVHSGPEWNRHVFNAENIDPRDLWETYLPAFKDLVTKAGVKEVMCAYNRFEGEPCCGSSRLLQQILRDEWGFKGLVLSDCWAISDFYTEGHHNTEQDVQHATAKAVYSGTDLECGESYGSLVDAVKEGLINEVMIDRSLKRLMKARFELGEMDEDVSWKKIPYSVVDCERHKALALRMAEESLVLLQNKNNILPLNKNMKIAVIGPNANDSVMQWGNYNGFPSKTVTLLEGLKEYFLDSKILYEQGCDHTSEVSLLSLFDLCIADGKKGFKAMYWNNMNYEGNPNVINHINTPFHFTTAGGTVFAPGVNLGNFSASYESVLTPIKNEKIVFSFQTQGHVKLYIDGKEVASGLNVKNSHAYEIKVQAGRHYDIKVDYVATEGDCATLNFDLGREVPLNISEIVNKVKDTDVVIFAGGISPQLEGEEMPISIPGFKGGDRQKIELPIIQTRLIEAIKKAGKKIVLINFSGSAMALNKESQLCDAIIQAWYPGQSGGKAIAKTLVGEYNPAGRLPITFYKSTEQLPDFEDYSLKGRTYRYFTGEPLFPFGHGLSYTSFEYGEINLSSKTIKSGESLLLTIPVSNIGNYDGEEVVQVYLRRPDDKEGPLLTLREFKRINIGKGKTKKIHFKLMPESFEWFDTNTNTMRILDGEYEILYGGTSDMNKLKRVRIKVDK